MSLLNFSSGEVVMGFLRVVFLVMLLVASCAPKEKAKPPLGLQPESSVAKAVLVSEPTQNDGTALDKDEMYVTDEIIDVLMSAITTEQSIIYIGSKERFDKIHLRHSKSKQLKHVDAKPYHWLQDMFEIYDLENGKFRLGVPWPNHSLYENVQTIAAALNSTAFIVPSQTPEVKNTKGDLQGGEFLLAGIHGTAGGNVERWTNKVGFIGQSDFPTEADAVAFSNTVFPRELNRAILTTDWLYLGHIDEVVKPIQFENMNDPKSCRITALIADPLLAMELIEKNPESKILDEGNSINPKLEAYRGFKTLCETFKFKKCENMKWSRLINKKQQWTELKAFQARASAELQKLKVHVENTFTENQVCMLRWIPVAQIYLGKQNASKILRRSTGGLYPNLTNGLIIHSNYITVNPANQLFQSVLDEKLRSIGISTKYITAKHYFLDGFMSGGHLHCMTQTLR